MTLEKNASSTFNWFIVKIKPFLIHYTMNDHCFTFCHMKKCFSYHEQILPTFLTCKQKSMILLKYVRINVS